MLEKVILVCGIIATISIGAFVISRDSRRLTNQVYGLMTLAMLALMIANSMTTPDSPSPLVFIKIVLLSTSVTIACLYMLTLLIIDDSPKMARSATARGLFIGTIIVGALDLSPLVFSSLRITNGQVIPAPEIGAVIFLLHFVILLALSIVTLARAIRHDRLKKFPQYRSFLYAFIPLLVLAPVTSFVLPVLLHQSQWTAFTPVYIVFLVSMIAYSMVRHGLFDIKQAAVRSFAYAFVLLTLTGTYYGVAYIFSKTVFSGTDYAINASSFLNVGLALLLAFLFQPVKAFFDKVTDSIFYRDRYDPEEFFALLSNVLSTTTDLKSLAERAAEVIAMTFKSRNVTFFVHYGDERTAIGTSAMMRLKVSEAADLDRFVIQERMHIISTRMVARNRTVYRILTRHGIELLLPLWHENSVIGYVGLGESLRSNYSVRDQRVLEATTDELVIAIQNVASLEEVSELNANLQQRIDTATHSLRLSNDKLRKLDDAKDEFISMASHQLRTPLTSVKGYISMILDGDAGEVGDMQRRFLTEAFESSNRMAGIIGDFLNVSRLQTGKFTLEREAVNLGEIVESEVQHLQNTAMIRGVTLKYRKPAHFPVAALDKSKVEQVVMNFIDNAIFYAPDTGDIDIELFQRSGRAVFTVRDHGIGVPKTEQASLFTKFFRATNARRKRPDGTGVGLFLAKKVVTAHDGAIIFESHEGKGSTFGFEIPLRQL